MISYKRCESAEDGIHIFDRAVHTRATPCIFCGEPKDVLALQAEPPALPEIIELQLAGLSAIEQRMRADRLSIVISNRLTRDWYISRNQRWEAAEIRAEVIRQLMSFDVTSPFSASASPITDRHRVTAAGDERTRFQVQVSAGRDDGDA